MATATINGSTYRLTSSAAPPRIKLLSDGKTSYLPLTTGSGQVCIKSNGSIYRPLIYSTTSIGSSTTASGHFTYNNAETRTTLTSTCFSSAQAAGAMSNTTGLVGRSSGPLIKTLTRTYTYYSQEYSCRYGYSESGSYSTGACAGGGNVTQTYRFSGSAIATTRTYYYMFPNGYTKTYKISQNGTFTYYVESAYNGGGGYTYTNGQTSGGNNSEDLRGHSYTVNALCSMIDCSVSFTVRTGTSGSWTVHPIYSQERYSTYRSTYEYATVRGSSSSKSQSSFTFESGGGCNYTTYTGSTYGLVTRSVDAGGGKLNIYGSITGSYTSSTSYTYGCVTGNGGNSGRYTNSWFTTSAVVPVGYSITTTEREMTTGYSGITSITYTHSESTINTITTSISSTTFA